LRAVRILMLSWRYLEHPQAGGAEIVTHEILRRLVRRGHQATAFTGAYPGCAPDAEVDGVRVLRSGRQWSVHLHAWRWLRRRQSDFDVVVDQVNTIPFMTPLYVRGPGRVLLIHQLARHYWFRETRGLFRLAAPFGYLAEPWALRTYRGTPALTISDSTAADLRALGIGREGLAIMPMALLTPVLDALPERAPGPLRTVVVGRLTPAKHVEEALEAFAVLRAQEPGATLEILGSGDEEYRKKLEQRARAIGGVTFHGRVAEERKFDLLAAADVHVFCSHREGWGLTVTEAGAMGTPTVGYDAPGVRDSVADRRGLAAPGDSAALGRLLVELDREPALLADRRECAWRDASGRDYERTTDVAEAAFSASARAAARAG
jgi:glycosyltransferase involved in cell wall biosynthesis